MSNKAWACYMHQLHYHVSIQGLVYLYERYFCSTVSLSKWHDLLQQLQTLSLSVYVQTKQSYYHTNHANICFQTIVPNLMNLYTLIDTEITESNWAIWSISRIGVLLSLTTGWPETYTINQNNGSSVKINCQHMYRVITWAMDQQLQYSFASRKFLISPEKQSTRYYSWPWIDKIA